MEDLASLLPPSDMGRIEIATPRPRALWSEWSPEAREEEEESNPLPFEMGVIGNGNRSQRS